MRTSIAALVALAAWAATNAGAQMHHRPMHEAPEPGSLERGRMGPMGGGMHSMVRHRFVMRTGISAQYEGLENPLAPDGSVLANGQRVYTQSCAACHGNTGAGDGPAAAALDPKPSNIGQLPRMPRFSSDAYLYWTVAEGGAPVGTAMPAFKDTLSAEDIWSVIHYLRAGL